MPGSACAIPYAIQVHGRELFLFARAWPYYRLPRERWAGSLDALVAAGHNAVVLNVPWCWHEPEEGELDLEGETDPRRDLAAALELCAQHGVYVIARPGPRIGASELGSGIPGWLLETHPEVLALDAWGRPVGVEAGDPPVTCLHPVYQAYVAGWYQAFLPFLRQALIGERGTVVAVEIDHCPTCWGLQEGNPLLADYNPWVVGQNGRPGLYQRWLAARYGDAEHLNRRYGTRYTALWAVEPPRRPPASYRELPWFSDWRRCKMDLRNQHLEYLYDWLRAGGIDVPIVVACPEGSPLAARHCADHFRLQGKPVLVAPAGGALAPDLAEAGGALGQVVATAELARRWVKGTALPPAGFDAPADGADGDPARAEVLWALGLGHGLNVLGLAAPVDGEGPAGLPGRDGCGLPGARRLGRFLTCHGERLVRTVPLADLALGWYEPYEDCSQQGDTCAYGWRDDYRAALHEGWGLPGDGRQPGRVGLLGLMALSGLSFAMLDLERDPLEEWLQYPQLWVLGLDFMAAAVQRDLLSYVRAGGHLVMGPRVPYLDERLEPCTLLDGLFAARPIALPVPAGEPEAMPPLVALKTGDQVHVAGQVDTFEPPPGADVLAWAWWGARPCAYHTCHGRGTATLLGFALSAEPEEADRHRRFIAYLAARAGVRRWAHSESMGLHVVERATPPGSPQPAAFLFVANPGRGAATSRLVCTHPSSGLELRLPRLLEGVEFRGPGALILALEVPIPGTGLTIAYCTSQVQGWQVEEDGLSLALYGQPHTMGELALRCPPGREPRGPEHWQRLQQGADEVWVLLYEHQEGETILHVHA